MKFPAVPDVRVLSDKALKDRAFVTADITKADEEWILEHEVDRVWADTRDALNVSYFIGNVRDDVRKGWHRLLIEFDKISGQWCMIAFRSDQAAIQHYLGKECPNNPALKKLGKRLEHQKRKIDAAFEKAAVYSGTDVGMF